MGHCSGGMARGDNGERQDWLHSAFVGRGSGCYSPCDYQGSSRPSYQCEEWNLTAGNPSGTLGSAAIHAPGLRRDDIKNGLWSPHITLMGTHGIRIKTSGSPWQSRRDVLFPIDPD